MQMWRVYQRGLERWIADLLQPVFDSLVSDGMVPRFVQVRGHMVPAGWQVWPCGMQAGMPVRCCWVFVGCITRGPVMPRAGSPLHRARMSWHKMHSFDKRTGS